MKNLIIIILCSLLLLSASTVLAYEQEIRTLSATMCEKIAKAGKKNVAVADFTDLQGNTTELGRFLAEELSSELANNDKGFEIVDRNNLRSILAEYKLSMSGLVDPRTVKELGQVAGVDAIVTGTVTPFGDSVRVSTRVLASDTAKVIGTAKGDIAKTKAIDELLAKGIETGTDTVSGGSQATAPAIKPAPKGQQQVEVKNFLFQVQKCKLSGQTVICDFLVTNKDVDRDLYIFVNGYSSNSRIIDNMGNEFTAKKAQLGNKSDNGDQGVRNSLVSNIPTKSYIKFEEVTSQATSLSLLEIRCGDFTAQIRNIPLEH